MRNPIPLLVCMVGLCFGTPMHAGAQAGRSPYPGGPHPGAPMGGPARPPVGQGSNTDHAMPKSDGEFIKQAATFGQTAIALCDLAAARGLSAAVKRLGSDLKADHEAVAVELNALAKTKHVDLPTHAKASDTKPAKFVVFMVKDKGAPPTVPAK